MRQHTRGRRDPFDREEADRIMWAAIQERESDTKAAVSAGVSPRAILRFRQKHGIPPKVPQMGNHNRK